MLYMCVYIYVYIVDDDGSSLNLFGLSLVIDGWMELTKLGRHKVLSKNVLSCSLNYPLPDPKVATYFYPRTTVEINIPVDQTWKIGDY